MVRPPTPTPARKVLWLLAYLVLHHGNEVSRETLAALLWPESDKDTARFYLRRSLTQLRLALGPFEACIHSPTARTLRLALSGDEVFCDVLAFDKATTPQERESLYTGALLPDCYDDWILPERERRADLVREAQERHEQAALAPSSLPCPLTELLGREREQDELTHLLRRCRLVTLLGPGGSGKTRLAIAAAEATQDMFADGAWFVDLSPLSDGAAVDATTLTALNLKGGPSQPPREALLDGLRTKNLLLVLDNAEHVLEAAAALALALLSKCPKLKVLVTSRQTLGLNGEQVYPVSPLALPPTEVFGKDAHPELSEKDPHALLDFSALRLFVERAMQASPAFRLSRSNAPSVAEICRRLDGMPLAIEMAATRVRYQSVGEIAAQLGERLDILMVGTGAVPERQRSLQAAIGWSYNLLSEEEQAAFRTVSVFHGGWTASMAEALLPGASSCLPSLVEKSLVAFHPGGDEGESRYSMLQTLQQFAVAKTRERGERESLQKRHLEYFSKRSEESRERLVGPDQVAELDWLEREHDNIRAALQFGCESAVEANQHSALVLAGNLRRFWYTRSYLSEASVWYERLLSLPGCQEITEPQGLCQLGAGLCAGIRGDHQVALKYYELCLVRQATIGNHSNQGHALNSLSGLHSGWGDEIRALTCARQSLYHAYLSGNLNLKAHTSINLGISYIGSRQPQKARRYLEKGLIVARQQGNHQLIGDATGALSDFFYQSGEVEKAYELGCENLEICRKIGRNHGLAVALCYMGLFLESLGRLDEARDQLNASLLLAQELRIQDQCTSVLRCLAELDDKEGRHERATTIWGAGMTLRAQHKVFPYNNAESLARLRTSLGDEGIRRRVRPRHGANPRRSHRAGNAPSLNTSNLQPVLRLSHRLALKASL